MMGRRYNRAKKAQNDGGAGTSKTTVDQIDPRLSTAEKLATEHGVDERTVRRAGQYAEAVMDWMDANQLGRRNITPDQFTLLLGRRYNRAKQRVGGQLPKGVDQIDPPLNTAEKLATEHGVSPATVKRAGQYAEAVAAVEKAVPGFSQAIAAPRQAVSRLCRFNRFDLAYR